MNPQDANQEYIRGNVELVRIVMPKGALLLKGRCRTRRGAVRGAG
jgi:hypothetical protein